jgi:hypothetical protein
VVVSLQEVAELILGDDLLQVSTHELEAGLGVHINRLGTVIGKRGVDLRFEGRCA